MMTLEQLLEAMDYGKKVSIIIEGEHSYSSWMHNNRSQMLVPYKENKERKVVSFTPIENGIEVVLEAN